MINPKVIEAWFTILAEASRGTNQAQEALKFFPKDTARPDEMSRWMTKFMSPNLANASGDFGEWYENWCRMMGFVPRSRYLELLERYEILRNRLEDSEKKVRSLQSMMGIKGQEEEAKKVLDIWGSTLEKTLSAQTEWMKAWTTSHDKDEPKDKEGQSTVDKK